MFRYDIETLRAIFGRKKLVEECLRARRRGWRTAVHRRRGVPAAASG
jgi:hypothetical protein